MPETLLIRADASPQIGTGHVMRCLALAQAWQDNYGPVVFATSNTLPMALLNRLDAEGMFVYALAVESGSAEDAQQTITQAKAVGAACVVVDGYCFDSEYQYTIKYAPLRLLFIDDNGHADYYSADLILNQNIHAAEKFYTKRSIYTQLLLGSQYVLLRREFLKWQNYQRTLAHQADHILVLMGGSDPENITQIVITALLTIAAPSLEVRVIVGPANLHRETLETYVNRTNIRVETNISDIPSVMAWADLAISAGGSTQWELAFMGVPTIALCTADNQQLAIEQLSQEQIVHYMPPASLENNEQLSAEIQAVRLNQMLRRQMQKNARQLIDGFGSRRVIESLVHIGGTP
jgi:UDP-2,4-diacetamido-2,4,6-trideoxy-beta-L-altropyranose hydrolase